MLAFKKDDEWIEWRGQLINDAQYGSIIETVWTDEELAKAGLRRVADPGVPEGKVATGYAVKEIGGELTKVYELEDAPPPPPLENLSKNLMWERMTSAEATAADQLLRAQEAKVYRQYDGASHINVKAELYPLLVGGLTQLFGARRAAEILEPNF